MFRGTDGCHVVGLHGIASVENSGKPHSRYGMVGGNPAIPYKTPLKLKEMIKMAENICEKEGHNWVYDDNWKDNIKFEGDVLKIPEHCDRCGEKAYETWVYSSVIDRETGELI